MMGAALIAGLLWFQSAGELYDRANALFEKRDMEGARSAVEQALRANPRLVPALTLKAKLAMASDRLDEAQKALDTAVAAEPRHAYARFLLGFVYYLQNDFPRARDTFALGDPGDPRVTLYRGLTEEALGNSDAAAANYELSIKNPKWSAEPRVAYARLLLTQGKVERAESLVDEILKRTPGDRDALYEKGRCVLERGDGALAAQFGERALAAAQTGTTERQIRYLLVRAYTKAGNRDLADKHRSAFEKLPMSLVR